MSSKSTILLMASIMAVFAIMTIPGDISAESNQVTVTPINEKVSLEKTEPRNKTRMPTLAIPIPDSHDNSIQRHKK